MTAPGVVNMFFSQSHRSLKLIDLLVGATLEFRNLKTARLTLNSLPASPFSSWATDWRNGFKLQNVTAGKSSTRAVCCTVRVFTGYE